MGRLENIEELFKASLASGFSEEKTAAMIEEESQMVKLAAGVAIPNPTYDKIISHVQETMRREVDALTSTPTGVSVNMEVVKQETAGSSLVDTAQGLIQIFPFENNNEIAIEVPFLFMNGELVPFDVIQFNGERAPYSRENLGKAINGLIEMGDPASQVSGSGFIGLEKLHNPSTTNGFLADTLNVRHRGNVIPDIGGMFVTADEKKIDGLLKEAATMKPYDWSKVEKAANAIADKKYVEFVKNASKEGEEISMMVKTASHNSDISKTLPWVNVKNVPHKTFIKFPEFNRREFSMTAGLVLRDLFVPFLKNEEVSKRRNKNLGFVVLTADGRIKRVKSEDEGFICLKANEPLFKLPGAYLNGFGRGDMFIARHNGKYTVPLIIDESENRQVRTNPPYEFWKREGSYNGKPVTTATVKDKNRNASGAHSKISLRYLFVKEFDLSSSYDRIAIAQVEAETPIFKKSDKGEIISFISNQYKVNPELISSLESYNANVGIISSGKKLIRISGAIGKTFTSVNEIEDVMYGGTTKVAEDGNFDEMMKVASVQDNITIKKTGATYSVTLKYIDKTERMSAAAEEKLEGLSESAVIGALIALNFSKDSATDLMIKVNNNSSVSCSLPMNANPAKIFGSKKRQIKKAISKFKNSEAGDLVGRAMAKKLMGKLGKDVAAPFVSAAIKDTALPASQFFVNAVMDKAASLKEEAAAVSAAFEKRAIKEESGEMRKYAKIMALCSHFIGDAIKCVESPTDYPHFKKLASGVADLKPVFEDAVSGLMAEKLACYKENVPHPMSESFYRAAIDCMDKVYGIAYNSLEV